MAAFELDGRKESVNQWKHGVSFAEASTFADSDHSGAEPREIIVGSERAERIRIIGAREATRIEKRDYEEAV